MDPVKEAFIKVKEEISFLKEEIKRLNEKIYELEQKEAPQKKQQIEGKSTTENQITADNPTDFTALPQEIKGLKSQNFDISTGNKGVTTDKPTDRQTNQQTDINSSFGHFFISPDIKKSSIDELKKAQDLLDSLDSIKKEIRVKFKSLTNREMLLFSTIYSLEDQGLEDITYRVLANHLNLTESSIRDYTNKLLLKGVPLFKIKQNNKQVKLKISPDFKKLVPLSTLLRLREI
ncbi:MAG: hypothetical protein QXX68_01645 [Candidatus Pacearchaeota archaeon]